MNKSFGFRGSITSQSAVKDIDDKLLFGNIEVSVENSVFEVGFDNESERDEAMKIANSLLASWSLRNSVLISVDFNQSWRTQPSSNRSVSIKVSDEIHANDRVITTSVIMKGMTYIIKPIGDNYSFANDVRIAQRAVKDETLFLALKYFHKEVVGKKCPMYGIHKAIEQITKHMPGKNETERRTNLANIVKQDKSYIDDLMTTIQIQRHSKEWLKFKKVRKIIDDLECKSRATNIINAYANSIT